MDALDYNTSKNQEVEVFYDSLHGHPTYPQGSCGTLKVNLIDTGNWLSASMDSYNPTSSPFKIKYNSASKSEDIIKTHTISYTVTNNVYSNLVPAINGTFELTINCPTSTSSSSITTGTAD